MDCWLHPRVHRGPSEVVWLHLLLLSSSPGAPKVGKKAWSPQPREGALEGLGGLGGLGGLAGLAVAIRVALGMPPDHDRWVDSPALSAEGRDGP